MQDPSERGVYQTLPGHQSAVTCVRFASRDRIFSADEQGNVLCWRNIDNKAGDSALMYIAAWPMTNTVSSRSGVSENPSKLMTNRYRRLPFMEILLLLAPLMHLCESGGSGREIVKARVPYFLDSKLEITVNCRRTRQLAKPSVREQVSSLCCYSNPAIF